MKEGVKQISWVSWNKVLVSKTDGGLGVGSIKTKNMGLLGKWKWRFINEQGALWRKVIAEIHGSSGGFDTMGGKIYRGTQTLFWKDNWLNNLGPLKECFPRLFALERFKDCLVADRWVLEEGVWQGKWDWNRQPSGRADGDLTKLVTDLNGFTLDEARDDRWEWTLTSSRKFTVASLCHAIELKMNLNDASVPPFTWNSWIQNIIIINLVLQDNRHSEKALLSTISRYCFCHEVVLQDNEHSEKALLSTISRCYEVVLQDNGIARKLCSPPFLATISVMKWSYKTMDIARKLCSPPFLATISVI
ncbi:reverse transcriptase domain, Reverse transcriptase zinc-binding domain protein [Artemisia annua]|uniref:Reverse transcriptase domain, Reverse transcriptase zinc-binding domain protein n=1 Tax=Artemisia annua TaxID=35608 RepID=A0A2U1Q2Z5_ARTAN|nr:reverse transcriptase domain, Reverse transcriptase zinc-binding domain protein [Artemisia annua]